MWGHKNPQDFFLAKKENQVDISLEFHSCARGAVEKSLCTLWKVQRYETLVELIVNLTGLDNFGGKGGNVVWIKEICLLILDKKHVC